MATAPWKLPKACTEHDHDAPTPLSPARSAVRQSSLAPCGGFLPQSATFQGERKFQQVVARALAENWAALPMGTRVAQFGQALLGTKYVAWTLEIDDRVESPSANFNGLDCWTFFEIALGLARMIAKRQRGYSPSDLCGKSNGRAIAAGCVEAITWTASITWTSGLPTTQRAATSEP
jgi:hypothetical protein